MVKVIMQTKTLRKTGLAIALGGIFSSFFVSAAEAATVKIDVSKQHYIGDTSELQRNKFFNLHARPGEPRFAEIDHLYVQNELNAGYGRLFWGPMSLSGAVNYPTTEFAMENGPDSVQGAKTSPAYPYYSKRVVYTEHPARTINEGNEPVDGARWAADYFEHYFDDETRPLFYEPMNEPFVHAHEFVDGPWDPVANQAMQEHMATWFGEIGREFDERGLETNVIGFSSAWPSYELWDFGHWESRQKMFMDVAGEHMDAFSFHLYDGLNVTGQDNFRSGSNAEAIIDMVEAYSYIKWGEIRDHAITEYGGIIEGYPLEYSPEKSSQELRSYNHLLFSMLEREDRILTTVPFITGASSWFYEANNFHPYSAAVVRPDPDKIVSGKVLNFLETEKAKFFKLWAEVKGNRVATEYTDPDLAVQAFNYGNKLYLALNNYEDDAKEVSLEFMNQGQTPSSVRTKRLDVPYGGVANYTDTVSAQGPASVTMAGHETVIIEYTYPAALSQDGIVRTQSYYADTYLQPIVENSTLSFNFEGVELQQTALSFADVYADQMTFDQSVVDGIAPNQTQRYVSVLKSYDRQLSNIIRKYPDTWKQSSDYARLVQRAERSSTTQTALQYHYSLHGYNDADSMAVLKMGIGRKHDKSKSPTVSVNGHAVAVPDDWRGYDQAERDDFFGTIEILVPAKFLKVNNAVDITFPDSQGHLSSLILEANTVEPYQSTAVSGVELAHTSLAINKDNPYRLAADVMPLEATNKFVSWQSSNPAVATVEDGVITPVSPGFTTITVQTAEGEFTDTTELEVKDQLTVRNTVVITNDVSVLDPTNSITLQIDYSTDIERDVTFEMIAPDGTWLALTRTTVAAGEGSTELTLSFPEDLPSGKGYRLITALRAVGGDWRTSVDGHSFNDVEITSPHTPPAPDPTNMLGTNGGFERGDLGDWGIVYGSSGSAQVVAEAAREGAFGVKFDSTNGRIGIQIDQTVLPEGVMQPGKRYKLSFYLKRVSTGPWSGGMTQFINTNGGWKTSGQQWFGGTSTDQWFLVEKEFDGLDWPATGTSIEVNLMTQGHEWHADEFKLEDITPE